MGIWRLWQPSPHFTDGTTILREVKWVTEVTQQANVRASETCSLVTHQIKDKGSCCAACLHCLLFSMSPSLAFCPSICLSIYPSIHPLIHLSIYLLIHPSNHPSIHPSTQPAGQPSSRLALIVNALKSGALPCLFLYSQLLHSTVFSTVLSNFTPSWLLSLDKALHLSKPQFLHL